MRAIGSGGGQHRPTTPRGGFLAGKVSTNNRSLPPGQQMRLVDLGRLATSVRHALKEADPSSSSDLFEWLVSQGLSGLVQADGAEAAAELAYRFADALAGEVRS